MPVFNEDAGGGFALAGRYGPETFESTTRQLLRNIPVLVKIAGTSTVATLYTDSTKTTVAANPFNTDAMGNGSFYANPGEYDLTWSGSAATMRVIVPVHPFETGATPPPLAFTALINDDLGLSDSVSALEGSGGGPTLPTFRDIPEISDGVVSPASGAWQSELFTPVAGEYVIVSAAMGVTPAQALGGTISTDTGLVFVPITGPPAVADAAFEAMDGSVNARPTSTRLTQHWSARATGVLTQGRITITPVAPETQFTTLTVNGLGIEDAHYAGSALDWINQAVRYDGNLNSQEATAHLHDFTDEDFNAMLSFHHNGIGAELTPGPGQTMLAQQNSGTMRTAYSYAPGNSVLQPWSSWPGGDASNIQIAYEVRGANTAAPISLDYNPLGYFDTTVDGIVHDTVQTIEMHAGTPVLVVVHSEKTAGALVPTSVVGETSGAAFTLVASVLFNTIAAPKRSLSVWRLNNPSTITETLRVTHPGAAPGVSSISVEAGEITNGNTTTPIVQSATGRVDTQSAVSATFGTAPTRPVLVFTISDNVDTQLPTPGSFLRFIHGVSSTGQNRADWDGLARRTSAFISKKPITTPSVSNYTTQPGGALLARDLAMIALELNPA